MTNSEQQETIQCRNGHSNPRCEWREGDGTIECPECGAEVVV